MRLFDYKIIEEKIMTPEIMNMVTLIHEHKGKQELYIEDIEANSNVLTGLLEIAKIQSTGASNRIEGIITSEKRLAQLVKEKSEPRNRFEQEIAGYREVLATIHEGYDYITPTANIILQLHRELYSFAGSTVGGNYKNADNLIVETDAKGEGKIRFKPVPAYQTREAMENLSEAYLKALNEKVYNPLIIIPMVILDFLCIHPFTDGNGRLSRLLTLLLHYREGYIVGKYISLEMIIEKTMKTRSKMKTILVIMAAGIGSRFGGGVKQLEAVGPSGEIIMDYSIHDALEAGFKKIVFIIRKDLEKDFKEIIGNRIEKLCDVEYAFQELDNLPAGFSKPEGRTKPWGTGQAVLSCKGIIKEPFTVINADDYYGKEAFVKVHDYLVKINEPSPSKGEYCMAGFLLRNTLSDNGGVTRGVCQIDKDFYLTKVVETHNIVKTHGDVGFPDGAAVIKDNGKIRVLYSEYYVSMNMWGLTPDSVS